MKPRLIASAGLLSALGLTLLAIPADAQKFFPKNNNPPPNNNNPNPNPNPIFNPNPGGQPKIVNPNPIVNQPKVVNPNPIVNQPKVVNPNPIVNQPKIVNPNPIVNQPKIVNPNPIVNQPKIVNPNPIVGQPKIVDPPKIVTPPKLVNPNPIVNPNPVVNPPKLVNPNPVVNPPKIVNPPNLIGQPKVVTPPNLIGQPKIVNPNPLGKAPFVPPVAKIDKNVAPVKVLPKIDPVRNPLVDATKVDPAKLAAAQKAGILNRQNGEQALIQQNKQFNLDKLTAQNVAKANVVKNLNVDQQAKFVNLQKAQVLKEADLRKTVANVGPGRLTTDPGKLLANAPALKTAVVANKFQVGGIDAARLAKINAADPIAKAAFADAARNRLVSPVGLAALQARVNDPGLPIRDRVAVAQALGVQGNLFRQTTFAASLNRLGGDPNWGPAVWPPRPAGAFVAGFLVGRAVFPGSGIYVPGYWDNNVVLTNNIFFPGNLVGYIPYAPCVYYPPVNDCDVCGSVVVQTLPCGCAPSVIDTAYYTPVAEDGAVAAEIPENVNEVGPDGQPAVVVDPTAVTAKQVTRFLRLVNSSKEKATVSILIRTPVDDQGTFAWMPEEPAKADAAFTVELMPGEEKDVYAGDTQLHGSRARIWATGENGRSWRQFENVDFWLVPETEEDGTHAYLAPGTETAVYNIN